MIFIFFVGWNLDWKRFVACFLTDESEFMRDVDFILLALEFLDPPDLTEALDE
jgi:hypothetical protein